MANSNNPFGLMYLGLYGGGVNNSAMQERRNGILYSNGTAIYRQDLMMQSANGYLYQWANATAVSQLWGVMGGCRYYSNSQQTITPNKYWPGTDAAAGTVLAQYIPGIMSGTPVFAIQTGATGITVADIGINADIVVGTGSTLTGTSGAYLDDANLTTTSTVPLRIVDLYANWATGNQAEEAGQGSGLIPGTQAGAYNWAVVALNITQSTGV